MTSIMNRATAVAMATGIASVMTMPSATAAPEQPGPYPALEAICGTLGPDSFVFAASGRESLESAAVGWVEITRRSDRTGEFLSHERVYERQPNLAVDEVCSFPLDAVGSETLTIGFLFGASVRLTGSDARSAWTP